jgi:preprotein translocase subunit SecE
MAMREKKNNKKSAGFFAGLVSELKKVVYPTRKTVQKNTMIVIIVVILVGTFISILDFGFDRGRRAIIGEGDPYAIDHSFGDIDLDNFNLDDLNLDFDLENAILDDEGNPLIITTTGDEDTSSEFLPEDE